MRVAVVEHAEVPPEHALQRALHRRTADDVVQLGYQRQDVVPRVADVHLVLVQLALDGVVDGLVNCRVDEQVPVDDEALDVRVAEQAWLRVGGHDGGVQGGR